MPNNSVWYLDYSNGVVNKVEEDGDEYTERYSIAECQANTNSFFYDFINQRLYVHTTNSDDPAGGSNYTIIVYMYRNICNSQFDDEPVIYPRLQEALIDGGLEIWTSATNLTHWTETIGGATTVNREMDAADVNEGGFSCRIDVDAVPNPGSIHQDIRLPPRAQCKIEIDYKHDNPGPGVTSEVEIRDSGSNVYLNSGGTWQAGACTITLANSQAFLEFELDFYAHRDYTNYRVTLIADTASESHYFDDVRLTIYREDQYYLPYLESSMLPPISQAVGDYYDGSIRMSFGQLRFINDGWWYSELQNYLYHNKDIIVKLNAKGADIEDFQEIYSGKTKTPTVDDQFTTLQTTDKRVMAYREVPINKFWTSNYPNLEDGYEGYSIPILYGAKENITPVCINTVTWVYKIADHQLQAITAVYKDGVALATPADYTTDLANGEFTLTADPGASVITCDAQGKLCDILTGAYSTNISDILHDFMINYVGVSQTDLDYWAFLDLKAGRSQAHCLYIKLAQSANDVIRLFQRSALFHVIQTLDGKFGPYRYRTAVPAGTPQLRDEDYQRFSCVYQTASIYKRIKVKYDQDPSDDNWNISLRTEVAAEYRYKEEDTLNVETTLKVAADADNLGDFYRDLYKDPQRKIDINIPTVGFDFIPSEKLIISKTRTAADGTTINVFSEENFRILELGKLLSNKTVDVIALEDLQSVGESYCAVCFNCEVCVTEESGSCPVCYSCEHCDTGQCASCQSCYYCEKCDAGQCTTCETCNLCQKCDTCQAAQCGSCVTCQTCDSCMLCNTCEICNTCECGQCAICQNCDACQHCYSGECASCQNCDACQTCDTGQCHECMSCNVCQSCNTCEKCDAGECSSCQNCNLCEKCNVGQCTSCESCNLCQLCNTCEKCNTGQCTTCMSCFACENCDTCEKCNAGCFICQVCQQGDG